MLVLVSIARLNHQMYTTTQQSILWRHIFFGKAITVNLQIRDRCMTTKIANKENNQTLQTLHAFLLGRLRRSDSDHLLSSDSIRC